MPKFDNETILLAFAVVTGLAVLMQTILLLAIFIAARKAAKNIQNEVKELRASLMPVILDTQELLTSTRDVVANTQEFLASMQGFFARVSSKIESAAGDVAEITLGLRSQIAQMQSSILDIMERVRKQSERLDAMTTGFLNTVDRAGGFVADVVGRPIRQISGMLGAVKSIIESLRSPSAQRR